MAQTEQGEVLFGINTIYTVLVDGEKLLCRIKGKQLRERSRNYNPIAPGDLVEVARDSLTAGEGQICEMLAGRPRPSLPTWTWRSA
jgi:ribosome biogenesis GTPase